MPDEYEAAIKNFERFVEMASALEKQNEVMQAESKAFLESKICPLMKEPCKKMECAWYIICLNNNMKAFRQFFQ